MRLQSAILILLLPALPAASAELPTKETPVGRLALPVVPDSLVVSPDSSRVVFASKAGDPTLADKGVFINPKLTNPADDSARAIVNPICLYIDDKPTIPFDGMSAPVFSPDSKHLGFAGRHGKIWQLVVDNKTLIQDADDAPVNPIVFSPDSAHVAWVVQKDGAYHVTVDDRPWPVLDVGSVGMLAFSPDSKHVAAAVHARAAWTIYVDGMPLSIPPAPAIPGRGGAASATAPRLERFGQYMWMPDSSGVASYAAFAGGTWQAFVQPLAGPVIFSSPAYDGIMKNTPIFSADGRQWAFAASTKNKWSIVAGPEKPTPAKSAGATTPAPAAPAPEVFDQILAESLCFYTPAGAAEQRATLVYLGQQNKKWRLYLGDRPGDDSFDAINQGSFMLSPDRHHFAFAAMQNGQTVIIKDGAVLARHDECGGATFAFSPDSQHLAYAARNGGNWFACVDGNPGAAFTALAGTPPAFSPDSSRIAFVALDSKRLWRLFAGNDGNLQTKPYDAFLKGSHVTWRADGTVVTIAIQKKVATRVEVKP